jgi:hypothetical protein
MPRVKECLQVIQLEGICWEIIDKESFPVLVFPQSQFGNLREFAASELGRSLYLKDRIELCIDIAKGLNTLHNSGML